MAWQIIRRVLGNPMPWLLAGLLGLAVYQHMQSAGYQEQRDAALMRADREEARGDALGSALDWQRDRIKTISAALATRDQRLSSIADAMADQRHSLEMLERNDAETRDWTAEPVPDATADWVRRLVDADSDRAGGDNADDTRAPDRTVIGTAPTDHE